MSGINNPIANPLIVLREEFDDWAILFNPDSGDAHGLNPIGVFVWKLLDGKHTINDIIEEVKSSCEEVSLDVNKDVNEFIEELTSKGLIGYEN
jgi:SynChlorMet cassette protein ScmD